MFSMAGLILIGLACYLFSGSPDGKGIGLGLVLFGFSILFLDHFSEERVHVYYQAILAKTSQ